MDRLFGIEGFLFSCACSARGCTSLHWAGTRDDGGYVSISMRHLLERPVGQTHYLIPKHAFYTGFRDFWTEVLDCSWVPDSQTFAWVDRRETPVAGREAYATTTS
jgi:hypothetical protein